MALIYVFIKTEHFIHKAAGICSKMTPNNIDGNDYRHFYASPTQ